MTNVKNINGPPLYPEKNSIDMRLVAIQHMSHFKWERFIFRGECAPLWEFRKGRHCMLKSTEPPYAGIPRMVG